MQGRSVHRTPWYLAPVKFLYLGVREFLREEGLSRSSSLAYASLLSLIPLAVVVITFAGAFGDTSVTQEDLIDLLQNRLLWEDLRTWEVTANRATPPEPAPLDWPEPGGTLDDTALERWRAELGEEVLEVVEVPSPRDQVVEKLTSFVDNIRGNLATIGIIGALCLLVTSLSLLNAIDTTVNRFWHVRHTRPPLRRFFLYWALLTLGPLLLLGSLVYTARFNTTQVLGRGPEAWISTFFTWGACFFLYMVVPHTRVSALGAAVAALVAGFLWEGEKLLFSHYVTAIYTGSSSYVRITYGSVALIPIFLLWLYLSWLVVLLGVKLTYVWQHLGLYVARGWELQEATPRMRELLAIRLVAALARAQYGNGQGLDLTGLALALRLPRGLLDPVAHTLLDAGILTRAAEGQRLLLGRPPDALTVEEVTRAISGETPTLTREADGADAAVRELAALLEQEDLERGSLLGAATFQNLRPPTARRETPPASG